MIIELTGEYEAILLELAQLHGLSPTEFVLQTLSEQSWIDDPVERRILEGRIADADQGKFVPEEEVQKRFLKMLRPA